jgi:hypothetical protein
MAARPSTDVSWAFDTGYCFRSVAEFVLLGTRGAPRQFVRIVGSGADLGLLAQARCDAMRVACEALCPARASGWDVWGNETGQFAPAGGVESTSAPRRAGVESCDAGGAARESKFWVRVRLPSRVAVVVSVSGVIHRL